MPRGPVKGAYLLLLHIGDERSVPIGSLGTIRFDRGTYVYIGSAMGGLEQRVARHLRHEKRIRWHIDHLTAVSDGVEALLIPSQTDVECDLASLIKSIPGATGVAGFGCSDCRCRSHLFLVPEQVVKCLCASFPDSLRRAGTRRQDAR